MRRGDAYAMGQVPNPHSAFSALAPRNHVAHRVLQSGAPVDKFRDLGLRCGCLHGMPSSPLLILILRRRSLLISRHGSTLQHNARADGLSAKHDVEEGLVLSTNGMLSVF